MDKTVCGVSIVFWPVAFLKPWQQGPQFCLLSGAWDGRTGIDESHQDFWRIQMIDVGVRPVEHQPSQILPVRFVNYPAHAKGHVIGFLRVFGRRLLESFHRRA